MTLFLRNKKDILLKKFAFIFLLNYILNAPKINNLYEKNSILKEK